MGRKVLSVEGGLDDGRSVRSYAHCMRNSTTGGVALAIINLREVSVNVTVSTIAGHPRNTRHTDAEHGAAGGGALNVWTLSTVEGTFTGNRTTVNGVELVLNKTGR